MARHENLKRRAWPYVLVMMWLMTTACWSSDSMFITLTATPVPTPTLESVAVDSLFQVGDHAVIVGQGIAAIYLTQNPEPVTRRNRVPNGACYANDNVEITAVEQVNGITYYRIECNNVLGWLAESSLSAPADSE